MDLVPTKNMLVVVLVLVLVLALVLALVVVMMVCALATHRRGQQPNDHQTALLTNSIDTCISDRTTDAVKSRRVKALSAGGHSFGARPMWYSTLSWSTRPKGSTAAWLANTPEGVDISRGFCPHQLVTVDLSWGFSS